MKMTKNYILRDVGGRCVAVPVGRECQRFSGFIKLNDTAKLIWKSIEAGCTEEETIASLTAQYDVTPEHARDAYRSTVEQLLSLGAVEQ
ncbi:MAG: PqqD family protein [Clostridiales bacterium]|nr:PqqD family protein [Clostridiales bacterium]